MFATLLAERIAILKQQVVEQTRALNALLAMAERVTSASNPDFDKLLECITMTHHLDMRMASTERNTLLERAEKFRSVHSFEQHEAFLERVEQRIEQSGADDLNAAQLQWRDLSTEIRAAMDAGLPAASAAIEALAQRWHAQVGAFMGTDPRFLTKLRDLYLRHPELMVEQSLSPAMMAYMAEAMAPAGLSLPREA